MEISLWVFYIRAIELTEMNKKTMNQYLKDFDESEGP